MGRSIVEVSVTVGLVVGVARAAVAESPSFPVRGCAADAVVAGTACLDGYEASRRAGPSTW